MLLVLRSIKYQTISFMKNNFVLVSMIFIMNKFLNNIFVSFTIAAEGLSWIHTALIGGGIGVAVATIIGILVLCHMRRYNENYGHRFYDARVEISCILSCIIIIIIIIMRDFTIN